VRTLRSKGSATTRSHRRLSENCGRSPEPIDRSALRIARGQTAAILRRRRVAKRAGRHTLGDMRADTTTSPPQNSTPTRPQPRSRACPGDPIDGLLDTLTRTPA
jgi:hypothetical protein